MRFCKVAIILTFFLCSRFVSGQEISTSRKVTEMNGIGERTYDLEGEKAEWLLGTSLLGNPDLEFTAMGLSAPTHRLPTKLAGIFTFPIHYDETELSMHGENGVMKEASKEAPIDTPVTKITWERFSFSGNAFGLDFRRLLLDSIELDIGVASYSDLYSEEFRYQDVTHQPYFALGRDSSTIPFAGRNIAMNSFHFRPAITWYLEKGEVTASASILDVDDDDVSNYQIIIDSTDYSSPEYLTGPFNISLNSFTYGISGIFRPLNLLQLSASIYSGTHEISYDSLPDFVKSVRDSIGEDGDTLQDTTWYGIESETKYETVNGDGEIEFRTLFNPALRMKYEFTDVDDHYHQDREVYFLELKDTLGRLSFRTQTGAIRNGNIDDSSQIAGMYSANAAIALPFHLIAKGAVRSDSKFPDIDELRLVNTGRYAFPSANLLPEERTRITGDFQWNAGGIFYGTGFRYEYAENPIKQRWVTGEGLESIKDAFQYVNLDYEEALDYFIAIGFGIGNWTIHLEREQAFAKQKRPIDVPDLFYKGSIHWSDKFVKNRLGVSVGFDFNWFNKRYDCEVNEDGDPELVELKHYLALNFEARMRILTFSLYTRIDNLNHSMYEPAAGYKPEGVRFLYGITWQFDN
ncbi:MAG: hypothetical protein M0P13_05855 [Fibrobacteraceae bacterium]|nr:hypothetical protein [Fibrobacteraceae bacterium]